MRSRCIGKPGFTSDEFCAAFSGGASIASFGEAWKVGSGLIIIGVPPYFNGGAPRSFVDRTREHLPSGSILSEGRIKIEQVCRQRIAVVNIRFVLTTNSIDLALRRAAELASSNPLTAAKWICTGASALLHATQGHAELIGTKQEDAILADARDPRRPVKLVNLVDLRCLSNRRINVQFSSRP
jgi:hypothetical protein